MKYPGAEWFGGYGNELPVSRKKRCARRFRTWGGRIRCLNFPLKGARYCRVHAMGKSK